MPRRSPSTFTEKFGTRSRNMRQVRRISDFTRQPLPFLPQIFKAIGTHYKVADFCAISCFNDLYVMNYFGVAADMIIGTAIIHTRCQFAYTLSDLMTPPDRFILIHALKLWLCTRCHALKWQLRSRGQRTLHFLILCPHYFLADNICTAGDNARKWLISISYKVGTRYALHARSILLSASFPASGAGSDGRSADKSRKHGH